MYANVYNPACNVILLANVPRIKAPTLVVELYDSVILSRESDAIEGSLLA